MVNMKIVESSDDATQYIVERLDNIVEEAKKFTALKQFHHIVQIAIDHLKSDESMVQHILKSTHLTVFDQFKLKFEDDIYRHVNMEGKIPCKGKQNRSLCYHQIVLGANTYAEEFFHKHGYPRDVAEVKACILWNYLNKVEYFKTPELEKLLDQLLTNYQDKEEQLVHMHRIYRKYYDSVDHAIMLGEKKIEGTKANPKPRPITFWNIFNPMYKEVYLNDKTKTPSFSMDDESNRENELIQMMRSWNSKHDKPYFKL